MKVFISWSGSRSKAVAIALRDWLPMVLQYVKPWLSDKDIGAGDRWAQSIAGELEAANFGIICVTPENIRSEWILFEAGALSKSMLDGKVIPLLYKLELSDLSGPLSQFQAQKIEENGVMEVVKAINKIAEDKTDDHIIGRLVPQLWPGLQAELEKIPDSQPSGKGMRPQHEILEELVTGVRGINARMRDFEPDIIAEKDRFFRRKRMRFHPKIFEEMVFATGDADDAPTSLLLMAGFLREDYPWIAELFSEAYREIRDGSPSDVERTISRLGRSVRHLSRSLIMRDMYGNSKEAMIMYEELPMFMDMILNRILDRINIYKIAENKIED